MSRNDGVDAPRITFVHQTVRGNQGVVLIEAHAGASRRPGGDYACGRMARAGGNWLLHRDTVRLEWCVTAEILEPVGRHEIQITDIATG